MEISRRALVGSVALLPVLTLPGCAGGMRFDLVDAIRRLLSLSGQRAFASLIRENGFFDDQLARVSLPEALGGATGSAILSVVLNSSAFRNRLTKQVNRAAEKGAELAAPVLAQAVRTVGIDDAEALIKGGPTAATDFLEARLGDALFSAMVPGVDNGLKLFDSGVVTEALKMVSGFDFGGLRDDVSRKASRGVFKALAREEAAIRANPAATNDPVLIGVFGTKP